MANVKKVTKKENFGRIVDIINGIEVENKTEILDFLNHEIELLNKKASKSSQTATQKENAKIMEVILQVLSDFEQPATITEIQASNEQLAQLSNQKISALLTQLKNANKIVRVLDKKKAKFSIA